MSNDAPSPRANDRAARAVARILAGEPFTDPSSLPAPWRDLAAGLLARALGQSASDVWETLIAGRTDADELRRAVLAALPGGESDVEETEAEHKPARPSDGAWLSPVDVPALPKAARRPALHPGVWEEGAGHVFVPGRCRGRAAQSRSRRLADH